MPWKEIKPYPWECPDCSGIGKFLIDEDNQKQCTYCEGSGIKIIENENQDRPINK